jgi:NADPH:quinone reductase-like Zn-dependent oxidoreductase
LNAHSGTTLASKENAEDLTALRQLVESGKLTPAIDRTYPLSEAAAAIRYVQEGHARGKFVIAVRAHHARDRAISEDVIDPLLARSTLQHE